MFPRWMSTTADYVRPGLLASRFKRYCLTMISRLHGLASWASRLDVLKTFRLKGISTTMSQIS
jgi:hypothetical protein